MNRMPSDTNPRRTTRAGPRGVLLLSLSSLPWLIAADDAVRGTRDANRRHVADMTTVERARLEENFRSFQSLPADQQARLRELQTAIEKDPGLRQTFEAYEAWVKTLSPSQRHELRQTKDRDFRLRMIEEFRHPPRPGDGFERFRPAAVRVVQKVLGSLRTFENVPASSREAADIIAVLEQQLPDARREQLKDTDSFTHMVRVLHDTLDRTRGQVPGQRLTGGLNDDITQQLIAALEPTGPAREFVEGRRGLEQRVALFAVLMRGLVLDLLVTIDNNIPTPEAAQAYEKNLPRAEREVLAKLSEPERQTQLQLRFLEEQIPGIKEMQERRLELQTIQAEFWRSRFKEGGERGPRPEGTPPNDSPEGSPRTERRPQDDRARDQEKPNRRPREKNSPD